MTADGSGVRGVLLVPGDRRDVASSAPDSARPHDEDPHWYRATDPWMAAALLGILLRQKRDRAAWGLEPRPIELRVEAEVGADVRAMFLRLSTCVAGLFPGEVVMDDAISPPATAPECATDGDGTVPGPLPTRTQDRAPDLPPASIAPEPRTEAARRASAGAARDPSISAEEIAMLLGSPAPTAPERAP